MDVNRIFGQTIEMATKALDLRSKRHEMIISNIANADTPGYKSFDLMVDDALKASSAVRTPSISVQRTDPGHLTPNTSRHRHLGTHVIQTQTQANLRGDGNTVDMDREMSNLAANQILYKTTARIISRNLRV